MRVHQVLAGAGPHDAVTGQARAYRARFRAWGWEGGDHATYIAPGTAPSIRPRRELALGPEDVLVIHHSAVVPDLDGLLSLPGRKLLVYHNITPPEWLWGVAPVLAAHCAIGREQLPALVAAADRCVGVSAFNAAELAAAGAPDPDVLPLLVDLTRLGPPADRRSELVSAPTIVFVGRLSPHKRQDELIRAFALYRRHRAPGARLELVGEAVTPAYGEWLAGLAARLVPGGVRFHDGLGDRELGDVLRRADVFACLSEHEGFCLPLVEAMGLGVPIVARRAAAVPETVGDAALLLEAGDDHAVVASLLDLVAREPALREELNARARRRVAAYRPEIVAARLREIVQEVAR